MHKDFPFTWGCYLRLIGLEECKSLGQISSYGISSVSLVSMLSEASYSRVG